MKRKTGLELIGGCLIVLFYLLGVYIGTAAMIEVFWRVVVAKVLSGMVKAELIPAYLTVDQLVLIMLLRTAYVIFKLTVSSITGEMKESFKSWKS